MYLLDTCVCVDFMRGRLPSARQIFASEPPNSFKIPAIVAAELYYSAERSTRPEATHRSVAAFLSPFDIVAFDATCTFAYGNIRSALERAGQSIGHNDLLIAATALANQAILVTNNVGEFKRVPGLSLESWHETELPHLPDGSAPNRHARASECV